MTNIILPLEGKRVHLTEGRLAALVDQAFECKTPPPANQRVLYMTHGAPGAGKSTLLWGKYCALPQNLHGQAIYISADEHGAMDSIAEYRAGLVHARTREERHALWQKYQADSQYLRSLIINRALEEGFSIYADTTAVGIKAHLTLEAAGKRGYHRHLLACYAPLDVSINRVLGRERQADVSYLLTRRIEAFESLVPMGQMADTLHVYYAEQEDAEAIRVFDCSKGYPTLQYSAVFDRMLADLGREGKDTLLHGLAHLMPAPSAYGPRLFAQARKNVNALLGWSGRLAAQKRHSLALRKAPNP